MAHNTYCKNFEDESHRRETFCTYEKQDIVERLVKNGFFYSESENQIVCYRCGGRRHRLHDGDIPERVHHSGCQFHNETDPGVHTVISKRARNRGTRDDVRMQISSNPTRASPGWYMVNGGPEQFPNSPRGALSDWTLERSYREGRSVPGSVLHHQLQVFIDYFRRQNYHQGRRGGWNMTVIPPFPFDEVHERQRHITVLPPRAHLNDEKMASEKDTPMNTVSTIISRAFTLQGLSSYGTLLSKNHILVLDFLYFSLSKILEMFHGGSTAEGTFTADSDLDRMMVIPDITVHTAQTDPKRVRGHIFLLDTSGSQPGFGRLRLVQLDDTEYQLFSGYNANIREMLQDTNDGTYLSSDKFVNFFVSIAGSMNFGLSSYRHGPCATAKHQDVHGYIMGKPGIKMETDIAHALQCDQWPVEAKEWITRERLHDWPTEAVVDKISHQKCHAVPIGDARSRFFSLEWRISFLLGERELVWNFNNTQVQCYVLLKMLLKTYIEPLAPGQLSSYHMKTIILWLSEEKGLSMWYDENLLQCVVESLNMLKSCIVQGELQHYFHRQRNLLTYKLENVSEKECVLLKIDEMEEDIITHALKGMSEWEELSEEWIRCNGNVTKFIEVIKSIPDFYEAYTQTQKANDIIKLYKTMFNIFLNISSDELHPFQVFSQLKELEDNPPENVMPLFREMTKLFLDLRVGMAYLRHTIDRKDELFQEYIQTIYFTVDDAVKLVSHARHIDSMSGVLYLASLSLCQGQFSASNDLVLSVLRQNKNLIYPGWCSRNISIQLTLEGKTRQGSNIYLCGKEGRTYPAYDVIFSFQDLNFVPYPVKFECALTQYDHDNFLVIHPCVYAYFLLCIGQYCLGGGAPFHDFLSHFEETVRETIGGLQRYRALNLLGFCYILDGNIKEACRCFTESLEDTKDFPVVLNAAVYHIGILIVSLLEAKEKEDIVYSRKRR